MVSPAISPCSKFLARIAAHKAITQAAPTSPSIEHIYSCVDALHIQKANALTCTLKQEHRCDTKGMRP